MIVIGVGSAPLQLSLDRESILASDLLFEKRGYSAAFTWVSRLLNSMLAILFLLLIKKVLSVRRAVTEDIVKLFFSLGVFLFFNYVLGAMFGSYSGLPSNPYLMLSIVFLMFFTFIKGSSSRQVIDTFRYVAFFMLIGSLFVGVLFPESSFSADSFSFEFSNSKRLIGLFDHPRQIGVYALMLLTVELYCGARGLFHKLILIVCPIAMLLAVSKTAILLAAIVLLLQVSRKGVVFFLISALGIILCVVIIMSGSVMNLTGGQDFSTLTGRTVLWVFLLDGWWSNPFFGNGPAYFSGAGATGFAHAHNIVLQALSDGGLFGLVGFIGYIVGLLNIALKNAQVSRLLSVLLVLLLLLFSMAEPIMRVSSFLDGAFFINLFVVLYLCALDRERVERLSYLRLTVSK